MPSAMYGRHHGVREFDVAAALLAEQPEFADVLVSHRFPLDDAAEAFRVSGRPRRGCDQSRPRTLNGRRP